jgi:hypothetical protein
MLAGMRRRGWVSLLAAALTLPAVLFVVANILKHGVGADGLTEVLGPFAEPGDGVADVLVSVLVIGGPMLALAIALAPIIRVRSGHIDETIEATVSLRTEWPRVAIAIVSMAVLGVLGAYLVTENADCWFGAAVHC